MFLQIQRCARHILRGGLQLNVGCADVMELLGHDIMGEFGFVAFAAQVREVKMAQFGRHNLRGGFGGGFIGKMAVTAKDALLETPGPADAILQHFHIVIGFEHQHIRGAGAFDDKLGDVAEVGDEPDVAGGGVNQKSDRVLGVMWDGERVNQQIGNFKARAGLKQVAVELGLKLKFKRILGSAIAINRDVQFLRDAGEAVNVITVLVGDEDGGEILRCAADAG